MDDPKIVVKLVSKFRNQKSIEYLKEGNISCPLCKNKRIVEYNLTARIAASWDRKDDLEEFYDICNQYYTCIECGVMFHDIQALQAAYKDEFED